MGTAALLTETDVIQKELQEAFLMALEKLLRETWTAITVKLLPASGPELMAMIVTANNNDQRANKILRKLEEWTTKGLIGRSKKPIKMPIGYSRTTSSEIKITINKKSYIVIRNAALNAIATSETEAEFFHIEEKNLEVKEAAQSASANAVVRLKKLLAPENKNAPLREFLNEIAMRVIKKKHSGLTPPSEKDLGAYNVRISCETPADVLTILELFKNKNIKSEKTHGKNPKSLLALFDQSLLFYKELFKDILELPIPDGVQTVKKQAPKKPSVDSTAEVVWKADDIVVDSNIMQQLINCINPEVRTTMILKSLTVDQILAIPAIAEAVKAKVDVAKSEMEATHNKKMQQIKEALS
jgi:hypothetical protein